MKRALLVVGLVGLTLAGAGSTSVAAATRACTPTPPETEGPYYKAGAPKRTDLAPAGTSGHPLLLTGVVRDTSCKPVANAKLDVWQADGAGTYDNAGYRLRGTTLTDPRGRFKVETVYPGLYPGRTRHIHVKISAPGGPVLTTQVYFPGVAQNASDGIFDPAMLVKLNRTGKTWVASYTFTITR